MQKVLFQTVGTGGEKHPVWQALALCVKHFEPDLLIQWCSEKTAEETVPKFKAEFPDGIAATHQIEICDNADDVESLMLQYARQIEEIYQKFPQSELAVDYTSGTKAMSAAATAAAVARQVPTLFYAVGQRDATGRVRKTDRHVITPTDQLIAGPLLDELGKLFDLGQYLAVKEQSKLLLEKLLRGEKADPELKARARTLQFLSEAYDDWDRFNWKKAFAIIRDRDNKLNEMLGLVDWDTERLTEQLKHLKRCSKEKFKTPLRLADLLANIQRRISAGYFDDAVSRLYRTIEFIVQHRIALLLHRESDENPTKTIKWDCLNKVAPQMTETLHDRFSDRKTIDIAMQNGIDILNEANDSVGMKLALLTGKKKQLRNLLDRRNDSWLAHGSVPVKEEEARELLSVVLDISQQHSESVNFNLERQIEIATFLKCPWNRK